MSNPLRAAVAHELGVLARPGGLLDAAGDRSTARDPRGRRALRQLEVASEFLARQPAVARGGRAAIVTSGAPGSGKSTWLSEAGCGADFRNIDPDIIKDLLLQRDEIRATMADLLSHELPDARPIMPRELAALVHDESTSISYNILQSSLRQGENVIISGTLGWTELPDRLLEDFEAHGYGDLTILDIDVSAEVAVERSLARWWQARTENVDGLGGRFVPRPAIERHYSASGASICHANAVYMFDRSDLDATTLVSIDSVRGTSTERRKIAGDELPTSPSSVEADPATGSGH